MLMLASFALLFQPRVFPPAPAQLGEGSGGEPAGFESAGSEQQAVVGGSAGPPLVALVAAKLKDRYFDYAIGQQLADALLAFEKNGRYRSIASGPSSPSESTDDIDKTSRAIGIPPGAFVADVVYSAQPLPVGRRHQ